MRIADWSPPRTILLNLHRCTGNPISCLGFSPGVLLREHYRCDPLIIGYCNRQFYDGKLVVMTKRGEDGAVSVIKTAAGEHMRSHHNLRQAEEVMMLIKELRSTCGDIGVIAPYNEQVDIIRILLEAEGIEGVKVATIHKFQGRENDVIIMSTVDNAVNPFVDDPHLLNVAVSRAKSRFVLVAGSDEMSDGNLKALVDYISYYGGASEGQVRSVFDLLYEQYAVEREAFIGERTRISQYDTENIIYGLLKEITALPNWSRLGILFQYDRVTHLPVLAIEVDGVSFHREGTEQYVRDRMKDSVLSKVGLPLLRLSTEGSNEREKIIGRLELLVKVAPTL